MRGQVVVERDRRRKTRAATPLRGCSLQIGGRDDVILAARGGGPGARRHRSRVARRVRARFAAASGEAVIDDGNSLPPTAQAQQQRHHRGRAAPRERGTRASRRTVGVGVRCPGSRLRSRRPRAAHHRAGFRSRVPEGGDPAWLVGRQLRRVVTAELASKRAQRREALRPNRLASARSKSSGSRLTSAPCA